MRASSKVTCQIREPDRWRTWSVEGWVGVAIRIERRSDLSSGQIVEQAIESVHRLIVALRSPEERLSFLSETPTRGHAPHEAPIVWEEPSWWP